MIARHETHMDKLDIWAKLSAPLPAGVISWRQDGKAVQRDGKYVARFVAYIDAQTVRERLDLVVPGEWDLTLELLPSVIADSNGEASDTPCAFKARIQILGVIREDVGVGRDYKSASSDAFKRAAVRFGIGHELYAYEQNWVQVDGDGRYAKPLEDPSAVYARKAQRNGAGTTATAISPPSATPVAAPSTSPVTDGPIMDEEVLCPKCSGRMFDNRLSKRNPKAPDYKCRNRSCDGVIWPPKPNGARPATVPDGPPNDADFPSDYDDDIGF